MGEADNQWRAVGEAGKQLAAAGEAGWIEAGSGGVTHLHLNIGSCIQVVTTTNITMSYVGLVNNQYAITIRTNTLLQ